MYCFNLAILIVAIFSIAQAFSAPIIEADKTV